MCYEVDHTATSYTQNTAQASVRTSKSQPVNAVLNTIKRSPATASEVALAINRGLSSVRGIIRRLSHSGQVYFTGNYRKQSSGRQAKVWVLA